MISSEKYNIINPEDITLFDYRKTDWYKKNPHLFHLQSNDSKFWEIGKHYILESPVCDGFHTTNILYEYKGLLKEHNDIAIDSVIMKRIGESSSLMFTLSKNDCQACGIEYEPQLELLPISLKWKKEYNIDKEFNENNLSTMPVNPDTGLIHAFVIKLNGFEKTHDESYIYSKQFNAMIRLQTFIEKTIMVAKRELRNSDNNMTIWHPNDIITNISNVMVHFTQDGMFLIVDITPNINTCEIKPADVEHLSINDLLEIKTPQNCFTSIEKYQQYQKDKKEIEEQKLLNQAIKQQLSGLLQATNNLKTVVNIPW